MIKEESRFAESNVFEGMISVRALIESAQSGRTDRRIQALLYDRARAEKEKKELAWLTHRSSELGFSIEMTDRETLDEIAIGSTHGGVIAVATERTLPPLTVGAIKPSGFYVHLDGVEDPYNFGYALRSLYALGACGVILGSHNWMRAAGVVCRASAGASERMDLYAAEGEEAIALFRAAGYRIAAADLRDSISSEEANLSYPLLLLVGGEKRGISRKILSLTDLRVRIDYAAEFGQSLSAASAATVLAYEVFCQNRIHPN